MSIKSFFKSILVICILAAAAACLISAAPVLSLTDVPSENDLAYGGTIPTSYDTYIDTSGMSESEASFIRDNTEVFLDGEAVSGDAGANAQVGEHKVTVNFCGEEVGSYTYTVRDSEPPVFTKAEDLTVYTWTEVDVTSLFEASDDISDVTMKYEPETIDTSVAGEYTVKATATDESGNTAEASATVTVIEQPPVPATEYKTTGTCIYIDIASQSLAYFADGKLALSCYVVTGNAGNHDTPTGNFTVGHKSTNLTLKGQEDNGDKYESFVSYWMPFIGDEYGMHDATWRGSFGGSIYQGSGSHGCVNMPYESAAELYSMVAEGTPVIIR